MPVGEIGIVKEENRTIEMANRKTYILAPDLTTPPPPSGPIALGHILEEPLVLDPLNAGPQQHLEISPNEIFGPHKMDGFTTSRRDMLSGKAGVWAKVLASVVGVTARAGVDFERDDDTVYQFRCLETTYFNPTKDYLRSSMAAPAVRTYMRAAKFAMPVYMITGIKVGRDVAVQSSHRVGRGFSAGVEVGDLGSAGEGGPEVEMRRETADGFTFTRGDDCVVALRLRKLTYKKGEIKDVIETRGATMQDGSGWQQSDSVPELELDEDTAGQLTLGDFDGEMEVVNIGDETTSVMIVPVGRRS